MKEELLNTILKLMRSGIEENIKFGATLLVKNFDDEEIKEIFINEAKSIHSNTKLRHDYPVFTYSLPFLKSDDIIETTRSRKIEIVSKLIHPIRITSFTAGVPTFKKDQKYGIVLKFKN